MNQYRDRILPDTLVGMGEHEQEQYEKGQAAARALVDGVNAMCNDTFNQGFLAALDDSHRTLQQKSTELLAQWLQVLKKKRTTECDGRNEFSVKFAQDVWRMLEENDSYYVRDDQAIGFPYI